MEAVVMGEKRRLSRRTLLRSGVLAGTAFLAGCAGFSDESDGEPTTSPPADALFREISFEGTDLVIQLREDHEVTGLNLIAPDGSTFAQEDVPAGATSVRIPILDIKSGISGYEHYTAGQHQLVAIVGEDNILTKLDLEPKLRITEVHQYRGGTRADDLGKLAVVIENIGTGPTWVYDITYQDAPNRSANDELIDDPGVPQIANPEIPEELIIKPNGRQTYVGFNPPYLFRSQGTQSCSGVSELSVIVGPAVGEPLVQRIRAKIGGDVQSAGLIGEYTCSHISVELIDTATQMGDLEYRSHLE